MDYPDFRLDGQVALVTGASKGIGSDLARALAAAGARVAVAARDVAALQDLAAEIVASGADAMSVEMDVADVGSIGSAVAAVVDRYGSLDIMVNNRRNSCLCFTII